MNDDIRTRILEELQRIHREIVDCAHCQALRGQYARLSELLPPDPVQNKSDGLWYVFNPPKEYEEMITRRLKQLGITSDPEPRNPEMKGR